MLFPRDVPTLTDGVVTLRAHRPEDAPGVVEQCVDPVSRRWTTVPLSYTLADARTYVGQVVAGGWESDREWAFAVEAYDGDVPRFAGSVSLRNCDQARAEVAYGAHPWVRGRGVDGITVMERAVRLLLAWGFGDRGLRTVEWWAHRGNWASRRLAWRVGFTVEGSARQWLTQRGELHDGWHGTLLSGEPLVATTPWLRAPRIDGGAVVLRPVREGDVPRIAQACADPDSQHWLHFLSTPYTESSARAWLEQVEERHASAHSVTWGVADPADDRLVGAVSLFGIVPGHEAEVGYWVHPDGRGRGVARETCRLALRHAFVPIDDGGLGLVRVHARAATANAASRAVLERSGMVTYGRSRDSSRLGDGSLADTVHYEVRSADMDLQEMSRSRG